MDNNDSFQFFLNFYADLPRQGPGDDRITRQILGLLVDLPPDPVILDMGCGSGTQTLVLAEAGCMVTAVDLNQVMLDNLNIRQQKEKFRERITLVCAGMESYRPEEPVDLIWSEGAIYIIGFEQGLSLWQQHLKKGGYLVASEITWLVDNPPSDLRTFWGREYPAMQTLSGNQKIIEKTGYRWIGSVLLPDHAWDAFYQPQIGKIERLRRLENLNADEIGILQVIEDEIQMFEKYRGIYGYVFYVMQRIS